MQLMVLLAGHQKQGVYEPDSTFSLNKSLQCTW